MINLVAFAGSELLLIPVLFLDIVVWIGLAALMLRAIRKHPHHGRIVLTTFVASLLLSLSILIDSLWVVALLLAVVPAVLLWSMYVYSRQELPKLSPFLLRLIVLVSLVSVALIVFANYVS